MFTTRVMHEHLTPSQLGSESFVFWTMLLPEITRYDKQKRKTNTAKKEHAAVYIEEDEEELEEEKEVGEDADTGTWVRGARTDFGS
jgi:hypothetical protein